MTDTLSDLRRRFLDAAPRYATVATLLPNGWVHQTVVWNLLRGDTFVINSREGRRWPANLERDPRISLCFEDGESYISVRGEATRQDDPEAAQADIAEMARRYRAAEEAEPMIARFRTEQRITFHVRPTWIRGYHELA